jgi:dimethylargininase
VTAQGRPQAAGYERRTVALVRPPGASFIRALSRHPDRDRIDPERARIQHAAYCRLLEEAGVEVVELGPDEAHPDACFTQDPAIVLDGQALLGRFGAPSRHGEEEAIAKALGPFVQFIDEVQAPATLEGGDLIRLGRRLVVGRSRRTNDEGIAALRRFAEPLGWDVRTAEVPPWALHLQTAATGVGEHVVLGPEDVVAQPAFEGMDRVVVADDDRGAGNVVSIGNLVIAAGSHPVHRELGAFGFEVHPTPLDEFERADGSPTCLSLLVDPIHSR